MHRPVLVTPPGRLPISVEEVRGYLPASPLSDAMIEGMIRSAVDHLDGWTGILGRCLVDQTWRQDFDGFDREMRLALLPVISIVSVTWRNADGHMSTVPISAYDLRTDAGSRSSIRFDADYVFPSGLHESRAVAVTYRAGYETIPEEPEVPAVPGEGEDPGTPAIPAVPEKVTVPANARFAIALMVQHMKSMVERDLFETQESVVGVGATMRAVTPYVGQSITDAVNSLLDGLRVRNI